MIIEATGKLQLMTVEDSILLGSPYLAVIITFKDPFKKVKKRVKLKEKLCLKGSTETMENFLIRVERQLSDSEDIARYIKHEVAYYFMSKKKNTANEKKIKELEKLLTEKNEFKVEVNIS